jgi:hypothetical protein
MLNGKRGLVAPPSDMICQRSSPVIFLVDSADRWPAEFKIAVAQTQPDCPPPNDRTAGLDFREQLVPAFRAFNSEAVGVRRLWG